LKQPVEEPVELLRPLQQFRPSESPLGSICVGGKRRFQIPDHLHQPVALGPQEPLLVKLPLKLLLVLPPQLVVLEPQLVKPLLVLAPLLAMLLLVLAPLLVKPLLVLAPLLAMLLLVLAPLLVKLLLVIAPLLVKLLLVIAPLLVKLLLVIAPLLAVLEPQLAVLEPQLAVLEPLPLVLAPLLAALELQLHVLEAQLVVLLAYGPRAILCGCGRATNGRGRGVRIRAAPYLAPSAMGSGCCCCWLGRDNVGMRDHNVGRLDGRSGARARLVVAVFFADNNARELACDS
jgi:hypothetical protein